MGFSSILPLALLLVLPTARTDGEFFRNDYTYEAEVDGWVKFHLMPETWDNARLRCFLEGSTLASPLNEKILAVMKKYMGYNVNKIFTGVSATYSDGDFYSVEGISWENIHIPKLWASGEPNNDGQENCITLDRVGTFADVSCLKLLPYMCFKNNLQKISAWNQCGTVDPDYYYETRIGHCYKVHRSGMSWTKAFMACSAEGGYLAVINSDVEAQALKELMAKYPENMLQAENRGIFAIGFHDWSQHGLWMTVHGQTITEAGYDKWSDGEPNNKNQEIGEYCGSMYRDATLNDIGCNSNFPSICEKLPRNLLNTESGSTNEV